jgi:hypothetical protein
MVECRQYSAVTNVCVRLMCHHAHTIKLQACTMILTVASHWSSTWPVHCAKGADDRGFNESVNLQDRRPKSVYAAPTTMAGIEINASG